MAANTLTVISEIVAGLKVKAQHILDFHSALKGDFVPRNSSGAPEAGAGELGTALYPWGSIRGTSVIVNGQAIDPDLLTTKANRIVSGKTRTDSAQVDFLRAAGSSLAATIQATATSLVYSIKGTSITLAADIALSSLTAAPSTNNTCLVNDANMAGATADKYVGERGTTLNIDTAGSEITALVGQMVALKGTTEILFGYLASSTRITNCYRGFFFDSSGAPIVREALSNNDTLTLMKIGYVFLDSDGATTDVSYNTPVIAYSAPSSPATGDYWLDQINQIWKRWSGTDWSDEGRTLIGMVVMDSTNCVASRSLDPYISYSSDNNLEIAYKTASEVQTKDVRGEVHVYGSELDFDLGHLVWDITADLESGFTEASSTDYYVYVDKNMQPKLSPERPYWRPDLKGFYHPYHAWRALGKVANDASSDFQFFNGLVSYLEGTNDASPVILRAYKSVSDGDQSVGAGATATVVFTGEDQDSYGFYSSNRLSPKIAGSYSVRASLYCETLLDNPWDIEILKNGSTIVASLRKYMPVGGVNDSISIDDIVEMNGDTDYLEIQAVNGGGVALNIRNSQTKTTFKADLIRG